ncbi:MAG TPA: hypothetical protein VM687_07655, partial [Stenotrophomonas sp.]|nr:hypothetical protein [Stenotrophomonas sp.]
MLKMKPWAIAITVACVLHAGPAFAQLADPTRTRSTTQVTAPPPPPVPVQRIDPAPPPPTPLSSSLGQRDQAAPLQVPPQAGAQAPQTPAIGMGSP